jgi:hypothetical protein
MCPRQGSWRSILDRGYGQHASIQLTVDLYGHLFKETSVSAMHKLAMRIVEARMTDETDTASRSHAAERERLRREAGLDETIEQSFPASDPPSTDPNPGSHTATMPNGLEDQLKRGRSAMANGMTSRVQTEAIWSIDLSVRRLTA